VCGLLLGSVRSIAECTTRDPSWLAGHAGMGRDGSGHSSTNGPFRNTSDEAIQHDGLRDEMQGSKAIAVEVGRK
jgi:hypothetical protein